MLRIETAPVGELLAGMNRQRIMSRLCPGHREELQAVVNENAFRESAAAELLLQRMVREQDPGSDPAGWTWQRGEHGKPFVPELAPLEFSLSHDGGMVGCALAEGPVGLDIQKICAPRDAVVRRCFLPWEQELVRTAEEPAAEFAGLWARREAAAKFIGRGMTIDWNGYLCVPTDTADEYEIFLSGEHLCRLKVKTLPGMVLAAAFASMI